MLTDRRGGHSDVLIIGAGSAGSIVAERLSADPDCRVTVVEAGPGLDDPTVRELTTDGFALPISPDSPVAKHFRSRLTDSPPVSADIVRGSCVGGSGAINGGYFSRALPADFETLDLPGWSWTDVEPHYRAVESRIAAAALTEFSPATTVFVESALAAGHRWVPDLNTPPGVGPIPLNIVDGRRMGPGEAFLIPALARPNLKLLTDTRAVRLRVAAGRVTGVHAVGSAGPVDLDADRVVVSAGAIGSAQLLMLSGIGPADDLRALGIPIAADLPVGRRSWDHPELLLPAGWAESAGRPVLEAVLMTGDLEIRPYTRGFAGEAPKVGVALMRPRGHGLVALNSPDPSQPPRIEHRYDSEAADVAALRDGCDLVADMVGTPCEPTWSTSQHLCGTAPMGGRADGHAVLDPQCRVHGVGGLWVMDGSVLPRIPSRGPHATIAMIGHRAAEFVGGR